jgi:hypothetical protein
MSGGSLDYLYHRVEEVAIELQKYQYTPLQRAFGAHLMRVSQALRDVEWVFDSDYGVGDDEKAIKEVLGDNASGRAFELLKADALELIEQLKKYSDLEK